MKWVFTVLNRGHERDFKYESKLLNLKIMAKKLEDPGLVQNDPENQIVNHREMREF